MTDSPFHQIFRCRASGYFGVLEERGDTARDRKKVETYVGGVLLRFLQIIACNGIEIMETNLLQNVQVSVTSQTAIHVNLEPGKQNVKSR